MSRNEGGVLTPETEPVQDLPELLVKPDIAPKIPQTPRGQTLALMLQGHPKALYSVPELEQRIDPQGRQLPKLVIGVHTDGQNIELSVRCVSGGGFTPKFTAGRRPNGGEQQVSVSNGLECNYDILSTSYWTKDRVYEDIGFREKDVLHYWKKWMIRVWRAFFPDQEMPVHGRRTKAEASSARSAKSKTGSRRQNKTSQRNEAETPSRPTTRARARLLDQEHNRHDEDGDQDEEGHDEDKVGELDSTLTARYGLYTCIDFWEAYNAGEKPFDLQDEELCSLIGQGYVEKYSSDDAVLDPPPYQVLRSAFKIKTRSSISTLSCEDMVSFRAWRMKMADGSRESPEIIPVMSLDARNEEQKRRRAEAQAGEQNATAQFMTKFLLERGMTRDGLEQMAAGARFWRDM